MNASLTDAEIAAICAPLDVGRTGEAQSQRGAADAGRGVVRRPVRTGGRMMAGDLFGERESDLAILSAIETRIAAAHARYGDFASTHEALGVAVEEWDELRDAIRAAIVRAAGPNWRSLAKEPFPGCKTPDGCRANGCLGWCDEYLPTPTVSTGQKHSSWHPAQAHSGAHSRLLE